MIISLRGTNGCGKTHLVRQIMGSYDVRREIRKPGRRHPVGYELDSTTTPIRPLLIPGHYEPTTPNGGIDTLGSLDEAYDMIWEHCDLGHHVLYEGKNMSDGVSRLTNMFDPEQARVVVISHPVEECVAAVRARGHRIKQETIVKIALKTLKDAARFEEMGYSVSRLSREKALDKVREILSV